MPLKLSQVFGTNLPVTGEKCVKFIGQHSVELVGGLLNAELPSEILDDNIADVLALEGLDGFVVLGEQGGQVLLAQF